MAKVTKETMAETHNTTASEPPTPVVENDAVRSGLRKERR